MSRSLPLFVAAAALAASGCSTALRAPVCTAGEFEFPQGAAGRYRLATVSVSPQFSDSYTAFDEVEFSIRDQPRAYEIAVRKDSLSGLRKLVGKSGHHAAAGFESTNADDPGEAVMPLAVCKIGGTFYSQQAEDDGTYTLSRLDLSPTGITTTPLVFDPDELERAGFKRIFVPRFESVDKDGKWSFDTMEKTRMIVDNSDLDHVARETLMSLAHPTAMGIVFSRRGAAVKAHGGEVVFRVKRAN